MTWDEAVRRYREAFNVATDEQWNAGRVSYYRSLWLYVRLLDDPQCLLEIGTQNGDSAFFIACAVAHTNATIYCVDPVFETGKYVYDEWDGHNVSTESDQTLVRQRIVGGSGIRDDQLILVPKTSEDYFKEWSGGHIDLVLVDGHHDLEYVLKDCNWMQHVRHGGYAVFDDWSHHVAAAVYFYVNQVQMGWRILHKSTDIPLGDWCVSILRRIAA